MLEVIQSKLVIFRSERCHCRFHNFDLITQIVGINRCMKDTDIGQDTRQNNSIHMTFPKADI